MKQERKTSVGRRDFLRALGAGAGVAVTAAAPLATPAAINSATPASTMGLWPRLMRSTLVAFTSMPTTR